MCLLYFVLARGSERFHRMFLESQLYTWLVRMNIDKALTLPRQKVVHLASVTTIMLIGAYFF